MTMTSSTIRAMIITAMTMTASEEFVIFAIHSESKPLPDGAIFQDIPLAVGVIQWCRVEVVISGAPYIFHRSHGQGSRGIFHAMIGSLHRHPYPSEKSLPYRHNFRRTDDRGWRRRGCRRGR